MPNTIAQNLQRLVNAKSAISEAITAKGGTVSSGDGFEDFPTDIATIPSGGGESGDTSKPVKFMDYDGSIVTSYTPEEFNELTEMPANPSHDGLTAQGWNWTLSDAKEYVSSYGTLNVGQMYITSDGRTRLYVRMQEGRLSPVLKLYLNANTKLDIDWGDDTHSTFTSTSADYKSERHTYASAGDYVVSIGVISGSFSLQSSSNNISTLFTNDNASDRSPDIGYLSTICKVEIGDGVTSIGTHAFRYCYSLSQITIPNGVTSIGTYTFSRCVSLSQITIPNGVTSIDTYAFSYCYSLSQITIPNGVTSIESSAFYYCLSLGYIKFVSQTPPTVTNSNTWEFIPRDCKILVPRGTLSAYKSATNYPSPSTYTYEEYG